MTKQNSNQNNARPSHTIRKKVGYSKAVEYQTIGQGWAREDGGMYIKLFGTQIIEGGFYAFESKTKTKTEENHEGGQ